MKEQKFKVKEERAKLKQERTIIEEKEDNMIAETNKNE